MKLEKTSQLKNAPLLSFSAYCRPFGIKIMIARTHQVAFQLDQPAFDTLKRLSAENRAPYATVISMALARLENSDQPTSQPASHVTSKPLVVYAQLSEHGKKQIREQVWQWRSTGGSFAAIAKRLFVERQISGVDRLPLSASTIRSICAR